MLKKVSKKSQLDLKTMNAIRGGGCGGNNCSCGCDSPKCSIPFAQGIATMAAAASDLVSSVT